MWAPRRENWGVVRTEDVPPPAASVLEQLGEVFATFGPPEQDSGNESWGVHSSAAGLRRLGVPAPDLPRGAPCTLFVKSAGDPHGDFALPHAERARLLRRAARLLRHAHPVLPTLHGVLEADRGPLLLLAWRSGVLLRVPAPLRGTEADPAVRLRCDGTALRRCIDELLAVHAHLAGRGWVAGDLYDGSVLVEVATGAVTLVDVDLYRLGPTLNRAGRMFGSTRFMAPEEHVRGARVDQRTAVFNLGRLVEHLCGGALLAEREVWGGLVRRATAVDPADRFADPGELYGAWRRGEEGTP